MNGKGNQTKRERKGGGKERGGVRKNPKRKDFLKGRRLEKRELIGSIRKKGKTFLKRKKSLEREKRNQRKRQTKVKKKGDKTTMSKKEIWKFVVQSLLAILTALGTALGVSSCIVGL